MKRDFPIAILSSVLLLFFIRDDYLSRAEGLILLLLMAAYLVMTVISAIRNPIIINDMDRSLPMHTSLIYIGLGLAAIIIGGDLVVDNACRIEMCIRDRPDNPSIPDISVHSLRAAVSFLSASGQYSP